MAFIVWRRFILVAFMTVLTLSPVVFSLAQTVPTEPTVAEEAYFSKIYKQFKQVHQNASALSSNTENNPDYWLGPGDSFLLTIPHLPINNNEGAAKDVIDTGKTDTNLLNGPATQSIDTSTSQNQQRVTLDVRGEALILPFGSFNLAGFSVSEVQSMLKQMTHYYLQTPQVYIQLAQSRPFHIAILGEVTHPGTYPAVGHGSDLSLSSTHLSQALSMAGGILPDADIKHISIRNAWSGQEKTVDLLAFLQEGSILNDPLLTSDDVVTLSALPNQVDYLSNDVAAATFSPERYTVRIIGYATHGSGANTVAEFSVNPRHNDIWTVLSQANTDPRANYAHVIILRRQADNTVSQITVNPTQKDVKVLPNDLIVLPHLRFGYALQQFLATVTQIFFGFQVFHN